MTTQTAPSHASALGDGGPNQWWARAIASTQNANSTDSAPVQRMAGVGHRFSNASDASSSTSATPRAAQRHRSSRFDSSAIPFPTIDVYARDIESEIPS